jgi:hypothetical protein
MSALSRGYADLEVLIATERGDGVYPVTVIESPAGQADGEFRPPMPGQELEALVDRMRSLDAEAATLTDFGARLFSAMFHGDVLSRYAESVGMTADAKGLRIRLHIVPPELTALPWELLYDPEKREFLSLSKRALITRYLHVPRPPSPLRIELPLRLLIAFASPQDLPALEVEAELTGIKKALSLPVEHNLIQFDVLEKVTTRALRDTLLKPCHILHFIGHGVFDEGLGSLAFEDQHGDAELVTGRTLGTLLKSTSVRLVVLNSCQSAQNVQNARAFTGVGPALVDAGVPAVVAMQFVVGDDSARVFTEDFYGMLSHYLPVDECVSRAREGMMLRAGAENVDWATPVLFLRAPDGVIFTPEGVDQVEEGELEKAKSVYLGDLSTERRTSPARSASELPGQKEIISHLWAMVDCPTYRRWVQPQEALSRWVAHYEDGLADELTREDVAAVVGREPVTVLLGEAGMGKTPILERLAFLHADQALHVEANALIPVFVKLSQYGGEESLVPLIRIGFNRHGQINLSPDGNDAQTNTLLRERRFIILMDSLCQIPGDEEERARGIAAVNRFVNEYPQHKHVVTCRTSFYDDHIPGRKTWLILPHSDEDVQAFFVLRFGEARGRGLYQSLPGRMRALARTPLLLSLLLDEVHNRGERAAKRRGPLFAHFASRMLIQANGSIPIETQKALLARLAYAMKLDQTPEYTLDRVLEVIGRGISTARLWETAPKKILDALFASGLLRTGSTGRVAFAHSAFQDYFAALVLQEQLEKGRVDWTPLLGRQHRWRETILFLTSMVEQPTDLISKLVEHDPVLGARCLLETETVNGGLRARIAEALAEKEKIGSEIERAQATEMLIKLHVAGLVPDVSIYRQAVDARTEMSEDERTTAVTVAIKGHLVVSEGPLAGLQFSLLNGTARLGRSSQANFALRDKSVSRLHAEIEVTAEGISIRDLGSTNGTQVNGKLVSGSWQRLQDGDKIQLGGLELNVELE